MRHDRCGDPVMRIRPIRTDKDHAAASRRIESADGRGSRARPRRIELDVLATLVEAYEDRHFPSSRARPGRGDPLPHGADGVDASRSRAFHRAARSGIRGPQPPAAAVAAHDPDVAPGTRRFRSKASSAETLDVREMATKKLRAVHPGRDVLLHDFHGAAEARFPSSSRRSWTCRWPRSMRSCVAVAPSPRRWRCGCRAISGRLQEPGRICKRPTISRSRGGRSVGGSSAASSRGRACRLSDTSRRAEAGAPTDSDCQDVPVSGWRLTACPSCSTGSGRPRRERDGDKEAACNAPPPPAPRHRIGRPVVFSHTESKVQRMSRHTPARAVKKAISLPPDLARFAMATSHARRARP